MVTTDHEVQSPPLNSHKSQISKLGGVFTFPRVEDQLRLGQKPLQIGTIEIFEV